MEKLLYFPQINLPKSDWSLRTFLYWDKIGIIYPENNQRNLNNDFNQKLLNSGFILKVDPYSISDYRKYQDTLYETLFSNCDFINNAKLNFQNHQFVKIHSHKFDNQIFNQLKNEKLALKIENSDWYFVEENVALLMMNFLATALSIEHEYTPATDNVKNLKFNFTDNFNLNNTNFSIDVTNSYSIRSKILEEIIPYPSNFNFEKILKFKEKHHSDLLKFRKCIDDIVDLSLTFPDENRNRLLANKILEINDEKLALCDLMKRSDFSNIIFGRTCGLVATISPVLFEPSLIQIPPLLYGLYTLYNEIKRPAIMHPVKYLALLEGC